MNMADSTAFDLLKSLATDHGFRSQLQSLDAQGKRDLLQRCGFGTLTASDMRTAAANVFGTQAEVVQAVASNLAPSAGMVTEVAASASAIETADGRALAPRHVAASASAIETVDVHMMASFTANFSGASASAYQKAA
jgi:hypothetical protein